MHGVRDFKHFGGRNHPRGLHGNALIDHLGLHSLYLNRDALGNDFRLHALDLNRYLDLFDLRHVRSFCDLLCDVIGAVGVLCLHGRRCRLGSPVQTGARTHSAKQAG